MPKAEWTANITSGVASSATSASSGSSWPCPLGVLVPSAGCGQSYQSSQITYKTTCLEKLILKSQEFSKCGSRLASLKLPGDLLGIKFLGHTPGFLQQKTLWLNNGS